MTCRARKSFVLGLAAWSLLAGSAAQAAPVPVASTDPLVAISVFGTAASRAAVCGADCVAMAAAAAQYPSDTQARDGSQLFILLGAVAALVAAYILLKDTVLSGHGVDIDAPIPTSPS